MKADGGRQPTIRQAGGDDGLTIYGRQDHLYAVATCQAVGPVNAGLTLQV